MQACNCRSDAEHRTLLTLARYMGGGSGSGGRGGSDAGTGSGRSRGSGRGAAMAVAVAVAVAVHPEPQTHFGEGRTRMLGGRGTFLATALVARQESEPYNQSVFAASASQGLFRWLKNYPRDLFKRTQILFRLLQEASALAYVAHQMVWELDGLRV